jgi:hypothetical protein
MREGWHSRTRGRGVRRDLRLRLRLCVSACLRLCDHGDTRSSGGVWHELAGRAPPRPPLVWVASSSQAGGQTGQTRWARRRTHADVPAEVTPTPVPSLPCCLRESRQEQGKRVGGMPSLELSPAPLPGRVLPPIPRLASCASRHRRSTRACVYTRESRPSSPLRLFSLPSRNSPKSQRVREEDDDVTRRGCKGQAGPGGCFSLFQITISSTKYHLCT